MIHRRANSISKSRRGDDEPIQTQRDFDGVGPQTTKDFYYHQDELFNVVAITAGQNGTTLPRHTGVYNTGDIIERIKYGDYGNPTVMQGASGTIAFTSLLGNRFTFTGREYDGELGWSYYCTRYLEHEWGRFTTRDTIGTWGDASNMGNGMLYGASSPAAMIDPLGLASIVGQPGYLGLPALTGNNIVDAVALASRGFSVAYIAALLGVSVDYVNKVLSNNGEAIRREAIKTAQRLARELERILKDDAEDAAREAIEKLLDEIEDAGGPTKDHSKKFIRDAQ